MKKIHLKVIFLLLLPSILFGLYVLANIIYAFATDYQPEPIEDTEQLVTRSAEMDSVLSFVIWNIGYGGLGQDVDFFYDGGENVRTPKPLVKDYLEGIYNWVQTNDTFDFYLFQEVDRRSARSHKTDELLGLANQLPTYNYSFAANYKVGFIPIPITKPMGTVHSGLASFSRFTAVESKRYDFPGNFEFPKRLFFLDRCFLQERFALKNGKELVVVNTHNSAYDNGSLKKQEMELLKEKVITEFNAGNYVIVGGDWNQCPPDFQWNSFEKTVETDYSQQNISKDYLPDWTWAYDAKVATNRKLSKPYNSDSTFTTIIDFYLFSPNIRLIETKGINLDFKYSDHQPVVLKISLNE